MTLRRSLEIDRDRPALWIWAWVALLSTLPAAAMAQDWREKEKLVGLGAYIRPAYVGADSMRTEPIPLLRVYGEHWFARTTQGQLEGGYRVGLTPTLTAGAQLSYEPGRRTKDSAFLIAHNVATLDPGAALGAHLEWEDRFGPVPANGLLRWRQNLDADQGAKADARFTVGVLATEHHRVGVFTQLTWASEKANQSYFGVTSTQATATGLPVYSAGAGLRNTVLGVLGAYDISRHWVALWSAEWHRLLGDARESPYTQDENNFYYTVGVTYRF
jgi:outer membrane scaffolding protein for murein synthesis (MipA/OmpV family)